MYLILSLIISLFTSFGLANYYNFFAVFAITFAIVLFASCFIHTIAEGENKCFSLSCKWICSGEFWECAWWIGFLPFYQFIFFGIGGGILLAPLWYFLSHTKDTFSSKLFLILSIVLVSLTGIAGVTLLISPALIYKVVHYGWIIGIFIGVAVISLITTIVLKTTGNLNKGGTVALCVGSVILIPIMILGIVLSMNSTYKISSAEDMKIFQNAPVNYNTVFVVEKDIDFEGKDISWFGARDEFEGVFDGQGHIFSNIIIKENDISLVKKNTGVIRNLVFDSCVFPYKGDSAIARENRGKIVNCNIMDVIKFAGHRYKIIDMKGSWESAKNYCEEQGGHLVTITSAEEQEFVSSLVQSYNRACWIGAYNSNGNWKWVTGETFNYTNWDDGEPSGSHSGGSSEDYVGIYANNTDTQYSTTGKWNDFRTTTETISGFVCEWDE